MLGAYYYFLTIRVYLIFPGLVPNVHNHISYRSIYKNDNLLYSPFLLPFFKASIHCAACQQDMCFPSFVSIGESPTTLRKKVHLSHSIRGNSDHSGWRHKLFVGGNPTFCAHQARPCETIRSVGSRTQQLLLRKIVVIKPHNLRSKALCSTNYCKPLLYTGQQISLYKI